MRARRVETRIIPILPIIPIVSAPSPEHGPLSPVPAAIQPIPQQNPQFFRQNLPSPYLYGLDCGCPTLLLKLFAKKLKIMSTDSNIQTPESPPAIDEAPQPSTCNLQPSTAFSTINHQLST